MTLRQRLLLSTLAVAIPLTAALFYLAEQSRQQDMRESAQRFLSAELSAGLVERCETEGGLPPPAPRGGRAGPGREPAAAPPEEPPPPPPDGRGRDGRQGRAGRDGRGGREGRGGPPRPAPGGPPDPVDMVAYDHTFASAHLPRPGGRRANEVPAFPDELKSVLTSSDPVWAVYSTSQGRGVQMAVRVDDTTGPCEVLLVRVRARAGEIRDQLISLGTILFIVVSAIWVATGPTIHRIQGLADHVRASAASHYDLPVPEGGKDEVGALARAFNEAGRDVRTHVTAVEARESTLREFVASTNHDIAVPLTVLQSHLASLEAAAISEDQADHLKGAMREAHYMGSLLRNLATASRLEGGIPVKAIRLDLNAVVDRVVARHQPLARAAGVEINFAVPEHQSWVEADPTLVEQALSNLIDNAVRYNTAGGHVAVVLDRTVAPDGTGGRFTLTIEDDGVGVEAQELSQLATRRFRGDAARSRRPDGQGIGLAITAETIERSGWSLTFRHNTPNGLIAEISGTLADQNS